MASTTVNSILVANRGEIAARVFRTCRRLGIECVAIHSDPDADAPFVAAADLAIGIGGEAPSDSYLVADRVIEAARVAGADAIHPGYGFLSENPKFAEAVVAAGLIWIGPPPDAMRQMASKVHARELMEGASVPVLPGGRLAADADVVAAGERVGTPLLVKASAGGGGKGMRLVRDLDGLGFAVEAARREASSAFGDPTVFLERYVDGARHVEIQVFADDHGNVAALHERDCSVQRRYQKIIEECPSPAVDAELRRRMGETATAAARAVDYRGAGTVEFLLGADREFFFLEMNTRLQVEHPVTEAVTGLDLVELQVRVAEGRPLPAAALDPPLRGHAIEARLYAEDPATGFLPSIGTLHTFRVDGPVRVDAGVADRSEVSPHYDPMLAKVIAHRATRGDAARLLAATLRRAQVHGVATNRDLLVRILGDHGFLDEGATTDYLDGVETSGLIAPLLDESDVALAAAAAALARQAADRRRARVLAGLPSGWRNSPSTDQVRRFVGPGGEVEVSYRLGRQGELLRLAVDGTDCREPRLVLAAPDRVVLEVDGLSRRFEVTAAGDIVFVNSARGQVALREPPTFSAGDADPLSDSAIVAPMPGSVIRLLVEEGQAVAAREPLIVLEAMKMEHEIVAPSAGTVEVVLVELGDLVSAGEALVHIVDDQNEMEEPG